MIETALNSVPTNFRVGTKEIVRRVITNYKLSMTAALQFVASWYDIALNMLMKHALAVTCTFKVIKVNSEQAVLASIKESGPWCRNAASQ